ncbi:MAG: Transcriptional regulator [Candelina submexicana]|nr:MAG: Transcriptional regulator [Candelina submexicana]
MPPVGGKGKGKGRDARRSRSRNTTPSSVGASASLTSTGSEITAYLETPISDLMIPANATCEGVFEQYCSGPNIPDLKSLNALAEKLKLLVSLAETRGEACDKGMRELSNRRKERVEENRQKEIEDRELEAKKEKIRQEAAVKEEEEEARLGRKGTNIKKMKDRSKVRETRPLTHGAHGVARQDGGDTQMKDAPISPDHRKSSTKSGASQGKVKHEEPSTSTSSLSPSSQLQSPTTAASAENANVIPGSPASSNSSIESHQPPPAPAIPQYQTFGPDPLTFDDPTIYHIREVRPGMSEEEIKEIYSVSQYPHDDLRHLVPGTPPDKDFSNAKPANQVSANTFATYIEPYLRPLTEEDMAFLKERGDRVKPFVMPRRGKRHYTEIWAEEDGALSSDLQQHSRDKFPANQARGSMEQMSDETAETEQISAGPMLNRLLAAMRPENRATANEEKPLTNGTSHVNGESSVNGVTNGDINMDGEANGDIDKPGPLPPATFIPDSTQPGWKVPTTKLDYHQVDERLKAELRHIGFLGAESEPDYDAHYDDDIAARLRYLQDELKKQSIINGARKARIQEVANERMAQQEYNTILEDLDTQVQQAYLKRSRTMGKTKKQKRPGGAGGGSHYVGGGAGISKPGIGDVAKQLMERRRKWIDNIGPVFDGDTAGLPGPTETIFDEASMAPLLKAEEESWDDWKGADD